MSFQDKELPERIQRMLIAEAIEQYTNNQPIVLEGTPEYLNRLKFHSLDEVLGYVNTFYKEDRVSFTKEQLKTALLHKDSDGYCPLAASVKGLYPNYLDFLDPVKIVEDPSYRKATIPEAMERARNFSLENELGLEEEIATTRVVKIG